MLRYRLPGLLLKVESGRVYLESETQRLGSIRKNVSEVRLAVRATSPLDRLFTLQSWVLMGICYLWYLQVIVSELDGPLQAGPERWIARLVEVFVFKQEESLRTHNTVVSAHVLHPPVVPSKCPLCGFVLCHIELVRCQFVSNFVSHSPESLVPPFFECLGVFELSAYGIAILVLDLEYIMDYLPVFCHFVVIELLIN